MKQVKDIMTAAVIGATPDTPVQRLAQMMLEQDCGSIPIFEPMETRTPVGVVTDRDICCRVVAQDKDASQTTAGEVMSSPVATVMPETSVDDCCQTMAEHQVRRILVIDEHGECCGIVAQADVAAKAGSRRTAEVVRQVSEPAEAPSAVMAAD